MPTSSLESSTLKPQTPCICLILLVCLAAHSIPWYGHRLEPIVMELGILHRHTNLKTGKL